MRTSKLNNLKYFEVKFVIRYFTDVFIILFQFSLNINSIIFFHGLYFYCSSLCSQNCVFYYFHFYNTSQNTFQRNLVKNQKNECGLKDTPLPECYDKLQHYIIDYVNYPTNILSIILTL